MCVSHHGAFCGVVVRHVPSWMPSAGFKRKAEVARVALNRAFTKPYALVREKMVRLSPVLFFGCEYSPVHGIGILQAMGDEKPSFLRTLIEESSARGTLREDERDIMGAGAGAYVGMFLVSTMLRVTQLSPG